MLDWCPVCENLIPPERYTITLPPLQATTNATVDGTPISVSPAATIQPNVKAGVKGVGGVKQPPGRRPGLNRQNSKTAAARKAATGAIAQATGDRPADSKGDSPIAGDPATQETAPTRRRLVISQGPTPLYCSEECRRKDYMRSTLSQPNLQAWNASQGYTNPLPFATGPLYGNSAGPDVGGRPNHYSSPRVQTHSNSPPSPFMLDHTTAVTKDPTKGVPYVDPRRQNAACQHPNNSASSASATATTTTASSESIASLANPPGDIHPHFKQPGHLQMTAMPNPTGDNPTSQNLHPGSAPATTDMDSHPSHAILNGANLPRNLKLDLDKWNKLPSRQDVSYAKERRSSRDQYSTYDLYKTTYPLAFESRRQQPQYASSRQYGNGERRRSGSRHRQSSRRTSEIPAVGWSMGGEDITPTQSLLITKVPVRKDDSFDHASSQIVRNRTAPPSSRASDSGSSDRSTSVKSHAHSDTSRRRSSRGSKRALLVFVSCQACASMTPLLMSGHRRSHHRVHRPRPGSVPEEAFRAGPLGVLSFPRLRILLS